MNFRDRADAGRKLAAALREIGELSDPIVLALPRGGVPVGFEVARALAAPLDVFVVRKLGVPGFPEYAMGAIASGDIRVLNDDVITELGIGADALQRVTEHERTELARRERAFRGDRPRLQLADRTVILVDDGLATGATMRAAIRAVRQQQPQRIIVALPVGAADSCRRLAPEVDQWLCLATPEPFFGVGRWYADFDQTSDDEVKALLDRAQVRREVDPRATPGWQELRQ